MSPQSTKENERPRTVLCRGVRGATTVTENTKKAILEDFDMQSLHFDPDGLKK